MSGSNVSFFYLPSLSGRRLCTTHAVDPPPPPGADLYADPTSPCENNTKKSRDRRSYAHAAAGHRHVYHDVGICYLTAVPRVSQLRRVRSVCCCYYYYYYCASVFECVYVCVRVCVEYVRTRVGARAHELKPSAAHTGSVCVRTRARSWNVFGRAIPRGRGTGRCVDRVDGAGGEG